MIEFKQVERQKGDTPFMELLSRVRTGQQNEQDVKLLVTLAQNGQSIDINNTLPNVLHIYPRLAQCEAHNMRMLHIISSENDIFHIKAEHHIFCGSRSSKLDYCTKLTDKKLLPDDDRECAGLQHELYLSVNSIVMLRRNINTSDGLVNGARGIVRAIDWGG